MTNFGGIQKINCTNVYNKKKVISAPKQVQEQIQIATSMISDNDVKTASDAITSAALAALSIAKTNVSSNSVDKNTTDVIEDKQLIVTEPAQLSLFHMNDFHGQSERMERAYTASNEFNNGKLDDEGFFDDSLPVDKLKLCSGDMFLGDNPKKIAMVNDFLNSTGVVANAVGNHECDSAISDFANLVKNKKYRLVATNLHPNKGNAIRKIMSDSFITEINGHKYGIIGASPIDFMKHTNRPEQVSALNTDDLEETINEINEDIAKLKEQGVNKILLLSHLGADIDKEVAKRVNDLDIILGGHTHTLFKDAKQYENVFYSPKGEPVLIVQSGRDGEYIGMPNLKFNELGQIVDIDYNVLKTDEFERDAGIKSRFQNYFGVTETIGNVLKVEQTNYNMYATENPHASFVLDCLRDELGTDIAVINSAGLRSNFPTGEITNYDLDNISPFNDPITTIHISEKELVDAIKDKIKKTVLSPVKRPGILQVSGARYEFDNKTGELLGLRLVDKKGKETVIDINNPSDKLYTVAVNEFSGKDPHSGLGVEERVKNPIKKYDYDMKKYVTDWLKKHKEPIEIKTDGRIIGR